MAKDRQFKGHKERKLLRIRYRPRTAREWRRHAAEILRHYQNRRGGPPLSAAGAWSVVAYKVPSSDHPFRLLQSNCVYCQRHKFRASVGSSELEATPEVVEGSDSLEREIFGELRAMRKAQHFFP